MAQNRVCYACWVEVAGLKEAQKKHDLERRDCTYGKLIASGAGVWQSEVVLSST